MDKQTGNEDNMRTEWAPEQVSAEQVKKHYKVTLRRTGLTWYIWHYTPTKARIRTASIVNGSVANRNNRVSFTDFDVEELA